MAAAAAAVAASTQRPLALLVYGATGFTGKYVCEYLAKTALTSSSMPWGIAGRNKLKLEELVRSLEAKGLSPPSLLLLADNRDPASLEAAAAQTRLLLNCTGPYRFLGEEVIKACLRSRTDCIDLCGEPEFMDRMLLLYHEEAKEKKVLLLSACAFDSVPADLGTIFAQRVFLSRGGAALSSIESFLSISTGGKGLHGHATTFEAAVHGFGSIRDLLNVRRELKRKYPYNDSRTVGPPLKARNGPYFESRMSRYAFKFPGSDASVVKASQRSLLLSGLVPSASSLPRYAAYFTVPSLWWAAVVTVVGSVFAFLAQRSWGRSLLLSHPSLFTLGAFTHEGPTEEQLAATRFSMTFIATGYHSSSSSVSTSSSAAEGREGGREGGSTPDRTERGDGKKAAASTTTPLLPAAPCDKILITRVTGPEPGYVATPIIFVELGGVYTPGAIFYSQPEMLFERLEKAGVRFEAML